MDIQQFYELARKEVNPEDTDIQTVKELVDKYPYFQPALFIYLKALYLHHTAAFDSELKRLSIFINDRKAFFYYIFSADFERFFTKTGEKKINEDKTKILLTNFFSSQEDIAEQADIEQNISHFSLATTDYFMYAQSVSNAEEVDESTQDTKTAELKHQNIIDSFIMRSEEEGFRVPRNKDNNNYSSDEDLPELEDDDNEYELNEDIFFTETLSKIYIKQKKYEKAYKIIKHLSLNYPKKNIYFADQLSFLEKLIINSKFKDTK